MSPIDSWYHRQEEPARGCLQFLRQFILDKDVAINERWKYGMPFFYYHEKPIAYFWFHKKYKQPYIGIADGNKIDHPDLLQEERARMKIFLIDPAKDVPVKKVNSIFREVLLIAKKR